MQFQTAAYLRRATSRAKSDVANKLISMLLHEISRRVVAVIGTSVTDAGYAASVVATFGNSCAYCQRLLEADRASVEHLDGMNRFRVGLHIPGNVIVACKPCNNAKRQDDQLDALRLAETGWESFLSHDGSRCAPTCKACHYWRTLLPDETRRSEALAATVLKIKTFRNAYSASSEWNARIRTVLRERMNTLYRDCQESANRQIQAIADELFPKS
jgi:hypothetical protein